MKKFSIALFVLSICALSFCQIGYSGGRADTLKLKIDRLERKARDITSNIHELPASEAESAAYEAYFLLCDSLKYRRALYRETIKDRDKLNNLLRQLDEAQRSLDDAHQQTLEKIHRSINPQIETGGLSVFEIKRDYGYVTYSLRVDVNNPGPEGNVYITIRGKAWDGKEIQRVTIAETLGPKSSVTLTKTTMVTDQAALDIRDWEISGVKFYPSN